jgi:hypothetical protein
VENCVARLLRLGRDEFLAKPRQLPGGTINHFRAAGTACARGAPRTCM